MPSLPFHVEQLAPQELSGSHWDVIVIGAGPAGTMAAAYLAEKGHHTLLVDKATFPRNKVCGDGLNHDAQRFLSKINLLEKVRTVGHEVEAACSYSTNGIKLVVPGPFISLQRLVFDAILAERAVQNGATFCQGKVNNLSFVNDTIHDIRIEGCDRPHRTRFVILATGAGMGLARSFTRFEEGFPSAMAARCYVQSREKIDYFVGSYVRSVLPGYGWIFPMGERLYNVGVIAFYGGGRKKGHSLKKRFRYFLEDFPLARKLVGSGRIVSDLVAAPLLCGLPQSIVPGRGNLIATGETIGTTLNFTGEGIGKALETGELAAQTIHKALSGQGGNVLEPFSEALDMTFRPKYAGFRTAEQWLSHPWINCFMARRGVKSEYLQKAVTAVITKEMNPKQAFSLKGVLRSFFA